MGCIVGRDPIPFTLIGYPDKVQFRSLDLSFTCSEREHDRLISCWIDLSSRSMCSKLSLYKVLRHIVLILGVIIGTYSSIFVASPALIEIQKKWGIGRAGEKKKRPEPATV